MIVPAAFDKVTQLTEEEQKVLRCFRKQKNLAASKQNMAADEHLMALMKSLYNTKQKEQ